jgi:hypothetical protein
MSLLEQPTCSYQITRCHLPRRHRWETLRSRNSVASVPTISYKALVEIIGRFHRPQEPQLRYVVQEVRPLGVVTSNGILKFGIQLNSKSWSRVNSWILHTGFRGGQWSSGANIPRTSVAIRHYSVLIHHQVPT